MRKAVHFLDNAIALFRRIPSPQQAIAVGHRLQGDGILRQKYHLYEVQNVQFDSIDIAYQQIKATFSFYEVCNVSINDQIRLFNQHFFLQGN